MEQRHEQIEKQGSRKAATDSKPTSEPPRNCPRCESTNTKFCYYNNYSSSQPRYFCRACRRYWTQGGTIRNLPHATSAARRAAKHFKRPSSTSYYVASASTSDIPLRYQMSTGAARPPWCFSGGGLPRQTMGYGAVDPSMPVGVRNSKAQPEMAGELNSAAGEEGDRILGNLFGGFEDASGSEGAVKRMPSASSGLLL